MVRWVGAVLLVLGVTIATLGYFHQNDIFNFSILVSDFYANVAAELVSIAITVLLIDALYERREIQRRKDELVLQLGSPISGVGVEAIRLLRMYRWHEDPVLRNANLQGADLSNAYLRDFNLSGCRLHNCKLFQADLSRAVLHRAKLYRANMNQSHLWRTDLTEANLSGANLEGAKLHETIFHKAHLIDANLSNVDIKEANFREANLCRANLSGATLINADFDKAKYDDYTQWPAGFSPYKAGAIK